MQELNARRWIPIEAKDYCNLEGLCLDSKTVHRHYPFYFGMKLSYVEKGQSNCTYYIQKEYYEYIKTDITRGRSVPFMYYGYQTHPDHSNNPRHPNPPMEPNMPNMPNMILARAYVLPQQYTRIFSPEEALRQGTLFPDLVRPYVKRK